MDENPPDDSEILSVAKADDQGWPSTDLEQAKKNAFWMGGVMECFSTVLSLFSKAELTPTKDEDWEIPFTELSQFLYLGAGAQGIVFRGSLRGELVAVKKLRHKSETDIKHLRKLDHDNIVRFRGVSTNGPVPCIIMEYCQHGPLFNYLHKGITISATQTFTWAKEIAQGMAYLHSNKIIHRDLKSPNILIAENLRVKVSDFGTSREWDNVSTIMSFTGTVAWMAPEVIRHEPCSERVDVWSYGVVLWELLTQEIPYRNLETHAIMWGVGTDSLSLSIPTTCPNNLQVLLKQCWRRVPRNRPPFKIIAAKVVIAAEQYAKSHGDCFNATQVTWPKELKHGIKYIVRPAPKTEAVAAQDAQRKAEIKQAKDVRYVYEQQLNRANELYMEVCAVRLQLEQREKDVSEREKALKMCRCGIRKNLKYFQRQTSSSSENVIVNPFEHEPRHKKESTSEIVVNFIKKTDKTVSVAVAQDDIKNAIDEITECACADSVENNNISTVKMKSPIKMKDTSIKIRNVLVEPNGNIIKKSSKKSLNDNYIPDVAQV